MKYYFQKTLKTNDFEAAVKDVYSNLKEQGFGVLNEIYMSEIFKEKLGVEFRKYKILSACNPKFAFQAAQAESNIGLLLPCNVLVQQRSDGRVEVSAIDPIVSMGAVENDALNEIADEVQKALKGMINNLN